MRRARNAPLGAAAAAAASLLLHLVAPNADAMPYMMLIGARPKCVEVKATAETTLLVDYHAPDLVTLEDMEEPDEAPKVDSTNEDGGAEKSPEEARADAERGGEGNGDGQKFGSGHDKLWYEKNKAKLEARRKMEGDAITDMVIMATEKGDTVNRSRERRMVPKRAPTRIREELKTMKGTVTVPTTRDGTVEICAQSLGASHSNPSLVSLSVRVDLQQKKEKEAEKSDSRNLLTMENSLRGLVRRIDLILKNADYAKEQEYEFHSITIAMNRAAKNWPMLHCAILMITGVTMAKHMTNFLKSHHI